MRQRLLILLALLTGGATAVHAQSSIRPGGTARGNVRTGAATTGNRPATGGTSSNSNGPRQYRSNTQLGDAIIQVDPETRSIVIVTDEDTHREMVSVIRNLDRPKPQVLIKVVFLEVTYNKGYDVGVEGSYTFNLKNPVTTPATTRNTVVTNNTASGTGTTTGTTTPTSSTSNVSTTTTNETIAAATSLGNSVASSSSFGLAALQAAGQPGFYGRVLADDYSATVRLLATRGKVEVLSRPSIMARNNQEAVIVVGQEVPFVTNSRVTDNGQTINTIQYDNVGIILRVTPFITSDNSVEMIVAPEISQLTSQTVAISNTVSSPVISKRSAETVVVTPNGKTAVIGGLMETQRITNISKIPLLGDIPLLGAAFRRTTRDDVKRELMIFLTPTIIPDSRNIESLTGQELQNTELVEKAFTGKEFEKFFDGRDPLFLPSADVPAHEDPAPRKTREIEKTKEREPIQPTAPVVTTTTSVRTSGTPAAVKAVKKKTETTTTTVAQPVASPTLKRKP